ncbi:hypothetical protein, partial [Klebsiella aerogenes]
FYIRTADKLQRTSVWLESLEGGVEYLREVIIHDKLGLNAQLEKELKVLQERVACEWQETLDSPQALKRFAHFINNPKP